LELDPNLTEAYAVRADLKHKTEWDVAGAEKDLLRAIELEPNNDLARQIYSDLLVETGRFDQAFAEIETALEMDPASLTIQRNRGRLLYFARRYDEATLQLKRVLEVDENFMTAYGWLWLAYAMKGDDAGAFEWFMKEQKRKNPNHAEVYQKAYENGGWKEVSRKSLEFEKLDEEKPSGSYYRIARLYARLGEKEQAFEYLNKAFDKRHSQMVMLNVEPAFDSLRDDPRFDELVRRVGLK
jgi:tetratricopeptide (TPR) repeat protein